MVEYVEICSFPIAFDLADSFFLKGLLVEVEFANIWFCFLFFSKKKIWFWVLFFYTWLKSAIQLLTLDF